ncbi:MAG: ABC transporter permease [Candidatus Brocadiia bacterium]
MRILRMCREGVLSLALHPLRTFFMMAGTVVGIAALTVIMAIGEGTQRKVIRRIETFGPHAIMVFAGGGKPLPPPDLSVTTLKMEDVEALREVDGIEAVSPMAGHKRMTVKYGGRQYRGQLWGMDANWHDVFAWHTASGEPLSAADVAMKRRVCLLGQSTARELFADESPLGEHVYLGNVRLEVKGILEERGTTPGGGDFDNRVVVPITTAMRRIMNVDYLAAIRLLVTEEEMARDGGLQRVARRIKETMRRRHRIGPAEDDDFRVVTAENIRTLVGGTSKTLSILLVALAGLSLLVGGVVLMNILLISVAERKAEIGLRRALGASRDDIFTQFLTESLAVTLLGMAIGTGMGWAICVVLPKLTDMPAVLSWQPLALGVTFALIVGTVFGVQPARRAAKLNPVEALR